MLPFLSPRILAVFPAHFQSPGNPVIRLPRPARFPAPFRDQLTFGGLLSILFLFLGKEWMHLAEPDEIRNLRVFCGQIADRNKLLIAEFDRDRGRPAQRRRLAIIAGEHERNLQLLDCIENLLRFHQELSALERWLTQARNRPEALHDGR